MVQRRQNRWSEKLTEMDNGRLVKIMYEGEVEGRELRGRPCKTWADNFKLQTLETSS